jgi:hypothetical protein
MIRVQLPSGKIVPVDTDDPKVAEATARHYVAGNAYESAHASIAAHPVTGGVNGGLETIYRGIPGLSEIQAGLGAAMDTAAQHPDIAHIAPSLADNFKRQRSNQQAQVDSFQSNHPTASNLTKGVTMAAPVAAAIMSGGATAAPELAEAAPAVERGVAGLLKRAQPVAMRAARRATVGGATGAVMGASQPGDLSDRLAGADTGAAVGATVGAVVPPALSGAAKVAGKVASGVGKTVVRAANNVASLSGNEFLDPMRTASQRLVESLKADGATPDLIKTALNGFLKNGATDPSLIDVASRLPSGGQNTLALVRGSAMAPGARGVATTYNDSVVGNLQDKALAATRGLTADARPASVVKDAATEARNSTADSEYGAIRAAPVDAAPILPALEGNAGRNALAGAYKGADARRLPDQMSEIDRLRSAAGPETVEPVSIAGQELPQSPALADKIKAAMGAPDDTVPVSLGTLHRTKVALEEAGRAAAKADANSVAGGLFSRAQEIDNHLAGSNPDYAAARDNYAKASAGIDAIDHGATGLDGAPDEYASGLSDLTAKGGQEAGDSAGIGYRQRLTDAIGHPAEGSTGVLNRIATATDQTRNLGATFGPDVAAEYQGGMKDLVDQTRNARFIDPNTGSGTAGRAVDAGLVEPGALAMPKISGFHIVMHALNRINQGATLTDGERQAITKIGTTIASPQSLDTIDLSPDAKALAPKYLEDMRSYIAGLTPTGQRENSQ